MIRDLLFHPDPRLKKVCAPVTDITDDLRALADDMLETMYNAPGIGLAAPQVNVLRRIITVDCDKDDENPANPVVMINPEVTASSEELNSYDEGCLSLPDLFAEVTRPAEVEVSWTDLDGNPQKAGFDGLWATCVQHEIDHLNGKLFIDHISAIKRQMFTRKMQKFKKELARTKSA